MSILGKTAVAKTIIDGIILAEAISSSVQNRPFPKTCALFTAINAAAKLGTVATTPREAFIKYCGEAFDFFTNAGGRL